MLIAEDLLVQLTDPSSGGLYGGKDKARLGLAGALLLELEGAGRLTVDQRGRLAVVDPRPTGDVLLDQALATFAGRAGRKPKDALPKVAKGLDAAVYARLVARGVARREETTVLWIFPQVRHAVDPAARGRTHAELVEVLLGRTAPGLRTGGLLALLHAVDVVPKVFRGAGSLPGRELRARAKTISNGAWSSEAVRKAISDAEAAVVAATSVVVMAGAAGGSS
ncbi:GOLPH3/VPS74 family protein [Ornithinicoccus halotolerans]|uniref:GOLPH3/VPS74 family protein n=1 Tax=Ornithinicoccus halotolerans TaxID=1748220 RepID=UPI001294CB5E|nr:GPP34 family phosphoprotein [Ornithinicoccus halotolerans]